MAGEDEATVLASQQFRIPPYSGHPVNTQYTSEKGTVREVYTIRDWVRRVDTIKGANKWDDVKTARSAQLMLAPGTPAGTWFTNVGEEDYMASWDLLKPQLLLEFATFINASDKVDILRSFTQRPDELVPHYHNRIQVEYKKFTEDIEGEFSEAPYNTETASVKAYRLEIIRKVLEYHLASFFLVGLKDELLRDVTKGNGKTLEQMLTIARFSEQASRQDKARHTLASVAQDRVEPAQNGQDLGLNAEEIAFIRQMRNGGGAKKNHSNGGGGYNGGGKSRSGGGTNGSIRCFFCLIPGHKANDCRRRAKERAEGKFCHTVNDAVVSEDEFNKLPRPGKNGSTRSYAAAAADTVGGICEETAYNTYTNGSSN